MLLPVVLLAFAPAAHCSDQDLFFESLAASPTSLDLPSFQTCIKEKLRPAMADCMGLTCTSQCKASLEKVWPTLDGSCCKELGAGTLKEKMCQYHSVFVPMIRAKIEAHCPSVFFESLAVLPTPLEDSPFDTCIVKKVVKKVEIQTAGCPAGTCSRCKASVEKVLATLDGGSCCKELGAGKHQEKICKGRVTGVIRILSAKFAADCPSVFHGVSLVDANAPAAGLGMFVCVAVAFAGGAIGAVAAATVIVRRQEIVTSPLLG